MDLNWLGIMIMFIVFKFQGIWTKVVDDEDFIKDLEEKIAFLHSALGQSCDFDAYNKSMPLFWEDFFHFDKTLARNHEDRVFNLKFSDIYVNFDEADQKTQNKTIYRYEEPWNDTNPKITEIRIEESVQRQLELSRCFTGGLITCDEKTQKCVCMDNPRWAETVLVNETTGVPLPDQIPKAGQEGVACFVKMGKTCLRNAYWLGDYSFDCVEHNLCDSFLGRCIPPVSEGGRMAINLDPDADHWKLP